MPSNIRKLDFTWNLRFGHASHDVWARPMARFRFPLATTAIIQGLFRIAGAAIVPVAPPVARRSSAPRRLKHNIPAISPSITGTSIPRKIIYIAF